MADKIFPEGLVIKLRHERAPEWVKGGLAIKVDDFTAFLKKHEKSDGWVNIDLLEAKSGKPYACLNQWKPKESDDNF